MSTAQRIKIMKAILCVFVTLLSFSSFATNCLYQGKIEKMYSYETKGKQAFGAEINESTIILGFKELDANLLNTAYITESTVCVISGSISNDKKLDGTIIKRIDPTKMMIFKH